MRVIKRNAEGSRLDYYGWLIIGSFMLFSSWGLVFYFKPIIAETNCSEMAANSSSVYLKEEKVLYPSLDYDTLKAKCMEEVASSTKNLSIK